MNTVATVISVSGLAWAQNAAGELRLLSAGDRIQADESLLTTPATRMLVDFGNGNIVHPAHGGGRRLLFYSAGQNC